MPLGGAPLIGLGPGFTCGLDAALVVDALENLSELTARPLVRGAGPLLEGVKLASYRTPPGGGAARA